MSPFNPWVNHQLVAARQAAIRTDRRRRTPSIPTGRLAGPFEFLTGRSHLRRPRPDTGPPTGAAPTGLWADDRDHRRGGDRPEGPGHQVPWPDLFGRADAGQPPRPPLADHALRSWPVVYQRTGTGWSAWVPALPGVGSTGPTHSETERLVTEAIERHLTELIEDGTPIPRPGLVEVGQIELSLRA